MSRKAILLRDLLSQCFDIFHSFGKQPETISSTIKAFMLVLEDCSHNEIDDAFKHWLREYFQMPVPAEIRKIIIENRKNRGASINGTHTQMLVREDDPTVILEKFSSKEHFLSPHEIRQKYPDFRVRTVYVPNLK